MTKNFHPENIYVLPPIGTIRQGNRYRILWWLIPVLIILLSLIYVGWIVFFSNKSPVRLIVYASSVQQEALTQGIFPKFENTWEAISGRDLTIEGVFGPSEVLARQIYAGAPADIVIFSHTHPIAMLRYGKLVPRDVQPVIIGCTPIVIITKSGNPQNITDFSDLAQESLNIIHASPEDSGVGQWAILAEYGSVLKAHSDPQLAERRLVDIWQNVSVVAPSARAALTLFELGAGDALVTYEQDAHLALDRGVALEIVVPYSTVLAQPVAVAVDKNIRRGERDAANAFMEYLVSETGREIFSRFYLYENESVCEAKFDTTELFTVDEMGSWQVVHPQIVNDLWESEIKPFIDLELSPILLEVED